MKLRSLPEIWRLLLVAASLLFGQQGAALHALGHAMHDVAVATQGEGRAPPLDHRRAECVAFCALDCTISNQANVPVVLTTRLFALVPTPSSALLLARAVFDSRAPPPSV
ncbi:MAG TPA: hypothetical protein VMJ14_15605 [Burkholderiales bacterium]|nr:hypothetical protein [Burkholderiales bacterium]